MPRDLILISLILLGWLFLLRPNLSWRQMEYRYIYLKSPGWARTKAIRKKAKCQKCRETSRLHLHHVHYHWHNRHPFLRYWVPNTKDPMQTLCTRHHAEAHGRKS